MFLPLYTFAEIKSAAILAMKKMGNSHLHIHLFTHSFSKHVLTAYFVHSSIIYGPSP